MCEHLATTEYAWPIHSLMYLHARRAILLLDHRDRFLLCHLTTQPPTGAAAGAPEPPGSTGAAGGTGEVDEMEGLSLVELCNLKL